MPSNVWCGLGWKGNEAGDGDEDGSLTRQCQQLVANVDGGVILVPLRAVLSPLP